MTEEEIKRLISTDAGIIIVILGLWFPIGGLGSIRGP